MADVVIVGLGYVGLPLARAAVAAGLDVIGYDVSSDVVASLNVGRSHVDDLTDDDVAAMAAAGFMASADPEVIADARAIVICVPTPLGPEGGPDLTAVTEAARTIAPRLTSGALVVLESTTWPGTTNEVLAPLLEESGLHAGTDFALAFSPERIDPGNPVYGVENTPKVVGGFTDACADRAVAFYERFIHTVVRAAGTREAEMAKLLENTYRQVNIALVNEMAKFSHDLGIDFWDVIRLAATKPFGFQSFQPGPGVGGHCIPIDPSFLSHRVRARLGYPFRFVELAQEVNGSMPAYVVVRAVRLLNRMRRAMNGSRVLVLGVTYKPGIADQRESPARPIGQRLVELGAELSFFDAYVDRWDLAPDLALDRVADLDRALVEADLVIHLQPHPSYDSEVLAAADVAVLDTRGVLTGPRVERL